MGRAEGFPGHLVPFGKTKRKRTKRKCVHHQSKDNYCGLHKERCRGTTNCIDYRAFKKKEDALDVKSNMPIVTLLKKKTKFDGTQSILMTEISINKNRNKVSQEKIQNAKKFYNNNKHFPRPILVSLDDAKYQLQSGEEYYYAAKDLNLFEIEATMSSEIIENITKFNETIKVGNLVWNNYCKDVGEIIEIGEETITIKMDSGEQLTYNKYEEAKNGNIRLM